jgi:hypothetical protein
VSGTADPHEPACMPVFRWRAQVTPSLQFLGGPERVVTDKPDPEFVRRPVGFTANLEPEEET